jgi:alpha-tubulin suppressor-like RCC1 family protein
LNGVFIKQVSTGDGFSFALSNTGTIYCWGSGMLFSCGLPVANAPFLVPTLVPLNNIVQVACGGQFTLLVDGSGKVWGFGENQMAQLGLGFVSTEVEVITQNPTLNNVVKIALGTNYGFALTSDGQVFGFGNNQVLTPIIYCRLDNWVKGIPTTQLLLRS